VAAVPSNCPHVLTRYAEFRIMPNRQRCGNARKGLGTAGCGIVLTLLVLRVGREDSIDWTAPFQIRIEHLLSNLDRQPVFDFLGRTVQIALDSVKVCWSAFGTVF
jgi:hypothetical protein